MRQLIYSAIQTPDGTILQSRHRHDYVSHEDANGETYVLDGGVSYIRRSINTIPAKELFLYADDPHEKVREFVERGGRGKNGDEELKYVKLKDIDDEWLEAIIDYEETYRPNNIFLEIYKNEVEWRKNES